MNLLTIKSLDKFDYDYSKKIGLTPGNIIYIFNAR
jgi:hypothetical protein